MKKRSVSCIVVATLLVLTPRVANTEPRRDIYIRHNLVSDLQGHAERLDPNLVNPWGIAYGPGGPFWFSDNGTGVSTVYTGDGKLFPVDNPLVVTVPTGAPTGIVFNGTGGFDIAAGKSAPFIFATETGTISGWNPTVNATNAVLKVTVPGAVYKGLALGNNGSANFLYATNFHAGTIDVFDSNFGAATLAGSFMDPTPLPAGFAPFGIQNIGGNLYVTYAKQDAAKHDDVAGPGNGVVNVFDTNGHFVKRLISGGVLNSPWGMAVAPAKFGELSGSLLIGNFGDGTIHGFDSSTGALIAQMLIPSGRPLTVQGLWGLIFGNGGSGGDPGVLYFTAGIPGPGEVEDHGLFGEIRPQHP